MELERHLGWRSRGYLPHCDLPGLVQHVVFSLADAVPELSEYDGDDVLDQGAGACILRDAAAAHIVEDVLFARDAEQYALLAWCVMPNHVHVVIEQIPGMRLDRVVQGWKSVAAHRINTALGRAGALWRREYFDRYMRDTDHFNATLQYVENNPVSAKLVAKAEDWRFSSARRRAIPGRE